MAQARDDQKNSSTGFTLIEVIVVVIIIGILASVALPKYTRTVERGRCAEARKALGTIRDMELVFFVENSVYTNNMGNLNLSYPAACNANYYFRYTIALGGGGFTATATRCTAGGKAPQGPVGGYALTINEVGTMGGTAAYL